jgi:CheY-like chemotaxis protein
MSTSHSPGRLLVVDDNKVNRLLLRNGLEQQGHRVAFAGRRGLKCCSEFDWCCRYPDARDGRLLRKSLRGRPAHSRSSPLALEGKLDSVVLYRDGR